MPLLESNLRDLRSGFIFPAYTKIMYARHMWFCGLHNNHMTGMTGFGYDLTAVSYRIAGNFRGRKLSQIGENPIIAEKTFVLTFAVPKDTTPQFRGENFHIWPQILEIRESFLPRKFSAIRYICFLAQMH